MLFSGQTPRVGQLAAISSDTSKHRFHLQFFAEVDRGKTRRALHRGRPPAWLGWDTGFPNFINNFLVSTVDLTVPSAALHANKLNPKSHSVVQFL